MPKFCWHKRKSNNTKFDAEGTRAVNEAANVLSVEQVEMQVRLALLKHLPDIIRESVRPMEKIEDIKILQVNGLGGFAGGANGAEGISDGQTTQASLADQMVNSALRYRSQAPLVDGLLKELGLNGSDINGLTQGLDKTIDQIINECRNSGLKAVSETFQTAFFVCELRKTLIFSILINSILLRLQ